MTDPSDIVERLKDCALAMEKGLFGFGKPSFVPPTPGLIREAASVIEEQDAEITRLRAALAEMKQRCAREVEERIDLWSQIEDFIKSEKERDLATARRKEAQCIAAAIRAMES